MNAMLVCASAVDGCDAMSSVMAVDTAISDEDIREYERLEAYMLLIPHEQHNTERCCNVGACKCNPLQAVSSIKTFALKPHELLSGLMVQATMWVV